MSIIFSNYKSIFHFINALHEESQLNLVLDVEIKNPFNIKEFEDDKFSVLDIKATDVTGRIYDIEIQSRGDANFPHRSLYYWARLYSGQIQQAETYKILKPVSCINILNFRLFKELKSYHSCYLLTEKNNPTKILTDHLLLHFIELPKLKENILNTSLQKWMQYIINEGKENNIMKTLLKDDPIFVEAHEQYAKFTCSSELRDLYDTRDKRFRDDKYYLETILENEKKKAEKRGEIKGIITGKIETACSMKRKGYPIVDISEITGLSQKEIEKI